MFMRSSCWLLLHLSVTINYAPMNRGSEGAELPAGGVPSGIWSAVAPPSGPPLEGALFGMRKAM